MKMHTYQVTATLMLFKTMHTARSYINVKYSLISFFLRTLKVHICLTEGI